MLVVDTVEKRARAANIVNRLPVEPIFQIVISDYDPKRSLNQNARYWKLLGLMEKETGHSSDELHDFFKEKFLGTRVIEIAGERAQVRPSTKKLGKKKFTEYMENVENFMIEKLGLFLE